VRRAGYHAADLLVGVAGIDAQIDGDLDGFVELAVALTLTCLMACSRPRMALRSP